MRRNLVGKLVLAAALMGLLPASAAVRRVWVPVYRPWGYWHDPFFYSYGPYYGPYGTYHGNLGEVKLDTKVKNAEVFVDGAYAGTAGKLKSMWLQPGAHDLEVRAPEGGRFAQRIYVLTGKTIHLRPALG
jgi:hypothetical protein